LKSGEMVREIFFAPSPIRQTPISHTASNPKPASRDNCSSLIRSNLSQKILVFISYIRNYLTPQSKSPVFAGDRPQPDGPQRRTILIANATLR
jgi:hypothetical protein